MTVKAEAQNTTALSPAVVAQITGLVIKALGETGAVVVNGDAVTAGIAKAHEALKMDGTEQVRDQWDGRPGAPLPVTMTGGPNTSVPSGSVIAGRDAAATGGPNMEQMIRHYSEIAAQAGVAQATEKLGRDIGGVRAAVKALVEDVIPGIAESIKAIQATVAKAAEPPAATTVAKAEDEKKEEDEEKKRDEAVKAFADEAENDADMGAARLRVASKSHLANAQAAWAQVATVSAKSAVNLISEIDTALTVAKALADSARVANPASAVGQARLDAAIVAFAKALPATSPHVSADWPVAKASSDTKEDMDKGSKDASGKDGEKGEDMDVAKAVGAIRDAMSGISMLQTTVEGLTRVVAGQSRNTQGLPPVFDLVKSAASNLDQIGLKIGEAIANGDLPPDDGDKAQDFMGRVRAAAAGTLSPQIVDAAFKRLPETVRSFFPQPPAVAAA